MGRLRRVHAPACSRVRLLDRRVVGAERELHLDEADLTKVAVQDHLARLLDKLMAGITVRHTDDEALAVGQMNELLCLLRREAERLLTDGMKPASSTALQTA